MRSELDDRLCMRFPDLFTERHGDPQDTGMCWGFTCGDGWYSLIYAFCEEIERMKLYDDLPPVVITQVKSKLGSLRIHWRGGDERARSMGELIRTISEHIDEDTGAWRMR